MRLIDADALKEKKVYSHERHEKIVPVAEIDWSPTIDAIPVEWMVSWINRHPNDLRCAWFVSLEMEWRKEQEER